MYNDYTWPLPLGFDTAEYTRIRGRAPKAPVFIRPVAERRPPMPSQSRQDAPRRIEAQRVAFDTPEAFVDAGEAICPICGLEQRVPFASRQTITQKGRVLNVLTCGRSSRADAEKNPDACGLQFLTFLRDVREEVLLG